MSKVGKLPVSIPAGVTVSVANGLVTVKGPKGELKQDFNSNVTVEVNGNELVVKPTAETKAANAAHGLYRALIQNMVTGVTTGFTKTLIITGVGYRAEVKGKELVMNLGYSNEFIAIIPEGLTVTADSHGNVKGYPGNPDVYIPLNYADKLDVGAAIGYGELVVIKDLGMKEPYVSQTPLGTSEVAEDLTYYFAKSEQTPSSVALGVLINKDGSVKQAGGFIIQVMPGIEEELIDRLENKISCITSVTSMLEQGMGPEEILQEVLGDFDLQINDTVPAAFRCDCSKSKVSRALIAMGRKELQQIIDEGEEIEVKCHFCNTAYKYSIKEIELLMETASLKNAAKKLGMNVGNESNAGARPEKPGNQHD